MGVRFDRRIYADSQLSRHRDRGHPRRSMSHCLDDRIHPHATWGEYLPDSFDYAVFGGRRCGTSAVLPRRLGYGDPNSPTLDMVAQDLVRTHPKTISAVVGVVLCSGLSLSVRRDYHLAGFHTAWSRVQRSWDAIDFIGNNPPAVASVALDGGK